MLKEKDRCCSSWKEKAETGRLEGEAETKRIRLDADQRLAEIKEQLRATFEASMSLFIASFGILCFSEKRESEEKFKSQIETLTQRNEELELENRKLRDEKYALDKKVKTTKNIKSAKNTKFSLVFGDTASPCDDRRRKDVLDERV